MKKYPWLRYSLKLNAVFCGPCSVLLPDADRKDKGVFVNRPFSNWVEISISLTKHSKHLYHRDSLLSADTLKTTTENPSGRIDVTMNTTVQAQMEENKHILHQIVRALCATSVPLHTFTFPISDLHVSHRTS